MISDDRETRVASTESESLIFPRNTCRGRETQDR